MAHAHTPAMLSQFNQYAKDLDISPKSPQQRFEKLKDHIMQTKNPKEMEELQQFFENLSKELPVQQRREVEKNLSELRKDDANEKEKKESMFNLLDNKNIQECLLNQVQQQMQKSDVSDEEWQDFSSEKKQKFAQKALEKFSKDLGNDIFASADRGKFEPLGLVFNHLYAALSTLLDTMLYASGIDVSLVSEKSAPDLESDSHPFLRPEVNPLHPRFIK